MQNESTPNGDPLTPTPPQLFEILNCVFDIKEHELRTLSVLTSLPGSTVNELANEIERDRSNVNRSLSTLYEIGLIDRERRLLEDGGYVYQYYPSSIEETKEQLHEGIDTWVKRAHSEIDTFDL